MVSERMSMFWKEIGNGFGKLLLSTGIFDSECRGNRFPIGRTRVPVCKIRKLGIFELRNRLLLGRNRVPRYIFPKKTENFLGTGSLPGGTGFLIHFSRS